MDGNNYVAKIVLTSFFGAQIKEVENEYGNLEKCVCIPIDRNNLRIGRTGKVSAYSFVTRCRNANIAGWSHYLKMKSSPDFVRKMNELGYEMPYLGNLKPSHYIVNRDSYEQKLVKVRQEDE